MRLSLTMLLLGLSTALLSAQSVSNLEWDFSMYAKKYTWEVSKELLVRNSEGWPDNNFDEAMVPNYDLPDLFTHPDGMKVTTTEDWEQERRCELLELFRNEVYGVAPPKPDNLRFTLVESDLRALGGKATLKRVAISFKEQGEAFTFHLTLFIPNDRKYKSPVILLLNHRETVNTDPARLTISDFWPAEYVIQRGYAIAAVNVAAEVDPDEPDASTGIREWRNLR